MNDPVNIIKDNNGQRFRVILAAVYFFLYIYLPPVTSLNLRVLLTLCNIIFIVYTALSNGVTVFSVDALKSTYGFIAFYISFLLLQGLRLIKDPAHMQQIAAATLSNTLLIFHTVTACLMLVVLCKQYGMTFDLFLKSLTGAGLIELVLVLMALLIPDAKSAFIDLIVKNSPSGEVVYAIQEYAYERSFGFADNLFDTFGYISAFIIGLTFLRGLSEMNIKGILISLVMLIMPLLNSRSGLLLAVMGIFIVCVSYIKLDSIGKYVASGAIAVVAAAFVWRRIPENTINWVSTGISQTITFLTGGGTTGIYKELLYADMQFPPSVILGAGYQPEVINLIGIDSGYVQAIWRYGLAGTIILFAAVIYYFWYCSSRIQRKKERTAFRLLLVILFIYMFKLFGLVSTGANMILFGVPVIAYYSYILYPYEERITR